jgi:hypothetical protein
LGAAGSDQFLLPGGSCAQCRLLHCSFALRESQLSKTRPADDPELIQLRQQMCEQFLVDSITAALDKGPALTNSLRSRIDALLASREIVAEGLSLAEDAQELLGDRP